MAIELVHGRYYLGFWYVDVNEKAHPPHGGSVMGCFWRKLDQPESADGVYEFEGEYRHRYYCEEEIGKPPTFQSSKDHFSWYGFKGRSTEEELIDGLDKTFATIHHLGGLPDSGPDKWFIKGTVDRFLELASSGQVPTWMNLQMIKAPKGFFKEPEDDASGYGGDADVPPRPGGVRYRGDHGGAVDAYDDYEALKDQLDPSRVALVMMANRIGVQSFVTFLEYTYFRPGTPMNSHFRFAIVKWEELKWFVVIIHKKHLQKADDLAKLLGLRRADGVPTMIHAGKNLDAVGVARSKETARRVFGESLGAEMEGMAVVRFPLDAPNVWTMENIEGHFTYENNPELEAKARAFEAQACEQVHEEHRRRLEAGEFDHEPGTMPPKRI